MKRSSKLQQAVRAPRKNHVKEKVSETRLSIPSILGFEWIAMDCAAAVAAVMQFSPQRIEDLRTAVGEACLNAIEHGNKLNANATVTLIFKIQKTLLQIEIHDEGKRFVHAETPHIDEKIEGKERPRGWGIFLIKHLADEVQFESKPKGGNAIKMVMHLDKECAPHEKEANKS